MLNFRRSLAHRLTLAARLDRWHERLSCIREKCGIPQSWLQEFQAYFEQPRMAIEEFWVRYTLKRIAVESVLRPIMSETEALDFYQHNDYMLWRNIVHRRHSTWRRILWTMPSSTGTLLEYGCGIAPISAWVAPRRPGWRFGLEDLDGPAWRFGNWRLRNRMVLRETTGAETYDVITAIDVFEHLADPERAAHALVERLRPGGILHWNFVDTSLRSYLNLATHDQRAATVVYLHGALDLVWCCDDYRVSRKRRHDGQPAIPSFPPKEMQ